MQNDPITRRGALAAVAAITAAPSIGGAAPSIGADNTDPIYAAIERNRIIHPRYVAACNANDAPYGSPECEAQEEEMSETGNESMNAAWDLATTVPSTAAGLAAVMTYERQYNMDNGPGCELFAEMSIGDAVEAFRFSIEKAAYQLAGLPMPADADAPERWDREEAAGETERPFYEPMSDPIFVAIQQHRTAEARFYSVLTKNLPEDPDKAAEIEASGAVADASWEFVNTAPTTSVGVVAMMAYEREFTTKEGRRLFLDQDYEVAFLFSIEKAVCRLAELPPPDAPKSLERDDAAKGG